MKCKFEDNIRKKEAEIMDIRLQTSQTKYKFNIYDFRTILIVILGHFRTNSCEY